MVKNQTFLGKNFSICEKSSNFIPEKNRKLNCKIMTIDNIIEILQAKKLEEIERIKSNNTEISDEEAAKIAGSRRVMKRCPFSDDGGSRQVTEIDFDCQFSEIGGCGWKETYLRLSI